jgi:hypothetical protein
MEEIVAQRRVEIAREESGAERNEGDWAMAVDEWIVIIDAHNLLLQQSQETAERKREEATTARENLFRRLGQKRKRTQDNDVSDSDEEGEISDDETTALPRHLR